MKLAIRIVLIVILLAQFIRPDRTNPPVEPPKTVQAHLTVPGDVQQLLVDACYDCHSHETQWPWYANVAPMSWLVVKDVNEGRRHLNFSIWGDYPASRADHKLEEVIEMVESGEMPLAIYVPLHPEADLSEQQRQTIVDWAKAQRGQYSGAADEGEDEVEEHEGNEH
jgi:hypothetical protein